ncbi:MAG: hypothetical protein MK052_05700 [Alphaproteobacteria bacterium]|nr:hypothetical protein [Alphaproteobacteria bacterium]
MMPNKKFIVFYAGVILVLTLSLIGFPAFWYAPNDANIETLGHANIFTWMFQGIFFVSGISGAGVKYKLLDKSDPEITLSGRAKFAGTALFFAIGVFYVLSVINVGY